jgi:hypothetical protein
VTFIPKVIEIFYKIPISQEKIDSGNFWSGVDSRTCLSSLFDVESENKNEVENAS